MNDILEQYADIIAEYGITVWETQPTSYRFNARVTFIDGSSLQIKEYLFLNKRKYAYHWQSHDGELRIRWDNAPHWKTIPTFPHHKHTPEDVFPSKETSLQDVLRYIASRIQDDREPAAGI